MFGVLGTAVCGCVFGLLQYVEHTWAFLGCSYGLRLVHSGPLLPLWASYILNMMVVVMRIRAGSDCVPD